jgi:hypothetical protein
MNPIYYQNAADAIQYASIIAPRCVGYRQGKGWFVYDAQDGCPADSQPEFFIAKRGTLPLPMTETAVDVWLSVLRALLTPKKARP